MPDLAALVRMPSVDAVMHDADEWFRLLVEHPPRERDYPGQTLYRMCPRSWRREVGRVWEPITYYNSAIVDGRAGYLVATAAGWRFLQDKAGGDS